MANILKDDRTYTDVRGVVYEDPYMIIDNFVGTNTPTPAFNFLIKIFKDEAARLGSREPIFTISVPMDAGHISTYLGTPQDAADREIPLTFARKYIYRYLGTELPNIPTIIWSDWKSDEVGGVPQTFIKTK